MFESHRYGVGLAASVATARPYNEKKGVHHAQVPYHGVGCRPHHSCITGRFLIRHFPGNGLGALVGPRGCLGTVVNSSAGLGALVVEPSVASCRRKARRVVHDDVFLTPRYGG